MTYNCFDHALESVFIWEPKIGIINLFVSDSRAHYSNLMRSSYSSLNWDKGRIRFVSRVIFPLHLLLRVI